MEKTALLSVYKKDGIVDFGKALVAHGWSVLASGGTAKALKDAGVPVRDVGELVGEPILGHRVVTLSREIHAALLARDLDEDRAELARLHIPRIDLVCVDLYPLLDAIAKPDATRASVIEMTDVGGPTMLHSAAKGERFVISNPADRMRFIEWLDAGSPEPEKMIDSLAAKADALVARYCLTSSAYRGTSTFDGLIGELAAACKYGENAWQAPAALYRTAGVAGMPDDALALANFKVVAGTDPSYNNWADVDRMLQTVTHIVAAFDVNLHTVPNVAVAVKHGNACGAAAGATALEVVQKMVDGDQRAIFGGLVMLNFPVDEAIADALVAMPAKDGAPATGKRLLDGIVAPSFTEGAIDMLARKGGKCRLIANPSLATLTRASLNTESRLRPVRGGFLKQPNYTFVFDMNDAQVQKFGELTSAQISDLLLAWAVGSTSNSNTVTLVHDGMIIGNGVGQQDRVGCCELAIKRATDAGHAAAISGAAAYSDSFFPFPDAPEVLCKAGIKAILTSSGSVKDDDTKAVCAEYGVALVMVPDVAGRGFYQH